VRVRLPVSSWCLNLLSTRLLSSSAAPGRTNCRTPDVVNICINVQKQTDVVVFYLSVYYFQFQSNPGITPIQNMLSYVGYTVNEPSLSIINKQIYSLTHRHSTLYVSTDWPSDWLIDWYQSLNRLINRSIHQSIYLSITKFVTELNQSIIWSILLQPHFNANAINTLYIYQ